MIRWPRVAVSASVQSGRMFGSRLIFGSETFTCVPSSAEGVLLTLPSVADTGVDRRPVATPLDPEESTWSPYPRQNAQLIATIRPDPLWRSRCISKSTGYSLYANHTVGRC